MADPVGEDGVSLYSEHYLLLSSWVYYESAGMTLVSNLQEVHGSFMASRTVGGYEEVLLLTV